MMNKEMATALFDRNSCLVEDRNVIPKDIAVKLTSEKAVEFAKRMKSDSFSGYGIGEYTMYYITRSGFLLAITYMNISEHKEGRKR